MKLHGLRGRRDRDGWNEPIILFLQNQDGAIASLVRSAPTPRPSSFSTISLYNALYWRRNYGRAHCRRSVKQKSSGNLIRISNQYLQQNKTRLGIRNRDILGSDSDEYIFKCGFAISRSKYNPELGNQRLIHRETSTKLLLKCYPPAATTTTIQ